MKRARSIDELVADPVGSCFVGATHIVWCASPTLCGSSHWGRPSENDAHELTRLYEIARHPSLHNFDVYMDDSALEHVEWRAVTVLSEYLRGRLSDWGRRIGKQAVVMPSGIVAAILAGVVPILGPTYPMRFFSSRGEALDWLAHDELLMILQEIDALVTEARGVAPVVRELRAFLEEHLADADVTTATRALARSRRTLQRELSQANTGFAVELTQARMRKACELLASSDDGLDSIARRIGCVNASHLISLFRRTVGETPTAYRARRRATSR